MLCGFLTGNDGVHVLNINRTYEKLMLAARIIVAVENPADVMAVSARPYGQRAVLKFAQYTGAKALAGRYTPGTFTNQITKSYREPRLLLVTDPRIDAQPVVESSYVNLPVIAFCDADSSLRYVDVCIPANNKGKLSIGLLYWMLAREVLRLRGTITRQEEWSVPVDLFFFRDPEEIEKAEEEQKARLAAQQAQQQAAGYEAQDGYDATGGGDAGGDFGANPLQVQAPAAAPQAPGAIGGATMAGFEAAPAPQVQYQAAPAGQQFQQQYGGAAQEWQ